MPSDEDREEIPEAVKEAALKKIGAEPLKNQPPAQPMNAKDVPRGVLSTEERIEALEKAMTETIGPAISQLAQAHQSFTMEVRKSFNDVTTAMQAIGSQPQLPAQPGQQGHSIMEVVMNAAQNIFTRQSEDTSAVIKIDLKEIIQGDLNRAITRDITNTLNQRFNITRRLMEAGDGITLPGASAANAARVVGHGVAPV